MNEIIRYRNGDATATAELIDNDMLFVQTSTGITATIRRDQLNTVLPHGEGGWDRVDWHPTRTVHLVACTVCGRGFDPNDPQAHAIATGHHADTVRRNFSQGV